MDTRTKRMLAGAAAYAAADKSDPFAYARAIAHIKSGVAGVLPNGSDAFYSAEEYPEQRTLEDGTTFNVPAYRNICRP
ncbi:MAG TPA: hypothetical protein DCY10_05320 [Clostridiales bacterium]|nr:hypothetical protein [Clostridiales bacterium]